MNNYNTKFPIGEVVTITKGLLKGKTGKIIGYYPGSNQGFERDNYNRSKPVSIGLYQIKIGKGLFSEIVNAEEHQLE